MASLLHALLLPTRALSASRLARTPIRHGRAVSLVRPMANDHVFSRADRRIFATARVSSPLPLMSTDHPIRGGLGSLRDARAGRMAVGADIDRERADGV